ncbi:hypothetical protein Esti_006171 [Eimeria stiedai]
MIFHVSTKEVTFDVNAVNHGEGDELQLEGEGFMSSAAPKPALAGAQSSDPNMAEAARVHKTVSFKPHSRSHTDISNGSAPAYLAGSDLSRDSHIRRKADGHLISASVGSSPSTQGRSSASREGGSASGSSALAMPQDVVSGHQQRRCHSDTRSACTRRAPGSQLSRRLGSRLASAFLAPFRELGGGELNFDWAYKEATTDIHEHTLSACTSTYKTTPTGSRRLSSRLSDAAMRVPAGLHYFPLRFRKKDAEKEYVAVTNYQLSLRLSIYLLLQHCFLLPLQFVLFFSDPLSRLGSLASDWFFKPLIFAFVGVSVFGLLLALALLYPRIIPLSGGYLCRKYAGQLACVYSFVYSAALSSSLIVGQLSLSEDIRNPALHARSATVDFSLAIQRLASFNTEISLLYVYTFASNLLLLDLIGPILTKWTLPLHVLINAGFAAPFIVGYADGNLYSLCTLLSVACTAVMLSSLAYLGHLSSELQHRLLFHQWRVSRLRLIELLNEGGTSSGKPTAMENVVGELEQCGKILLQMKHVKQDFGEECDELYRIVSDCRRTLLTNENLYTVDLCNADRFSKHYMQLHSRYSTPLIEDLRSWSNQRSLATTYQMKGTASSVGGRLSADMKDMLPQPEEPLLDLAELHSESIGTRWSYSVLELDKQTQGALFVVGASLLANVVTDWGCTREELSGFLYALQSQYQENPYHNQMHAAMVGHATVCLANMLDIWPHMDPVEKAALAVAALAHDVGHPGRTNQFFVMCFDPLAIIYNDNAPLENFHSCLCFRILERKSCNMFFLLSVGAFRFVRAKIIECILSTDMKQHFEAISKFRVRRLNEEFSMRSSVEDRWAALKMCIKMGDLSHTSIAWREHFNMSCAITEEFYQQGDEELRRGLPVSPLCSRATCMDIPKSQESFLSFLARPLLVELAELDASNRVNEEVLSALDANLSRWKAFALEGVAVPMPTTEKRTQSRTFTLNAVRNLAAPALTLANLPSAEAASGLYSKDGEYRVGAGTALHCEHPDTLPVNPYDWMRLPEEMTSSQWSPRFTVDSVVIPSRDGPPSPTSLESGVILED